MPDIQFPDKPPTAADARQEIQYRQQQLQAVRQQQVELEARVIWLNGFATALEEAETPAVTG